MIYGFDIGGTKTEFAVFGAGLAPLLTRRTRTPADDYRHFVRTLVELAEDADRRFGRADAVGVGLPGIRDAEGRSFAANVPCLLDRNVQADLSAAFGRPVDVINDGRAFVLSEAHGGAGDGKDPLVGVILGTGAFGGFCVGGRIQIGRAGVAGEWGHFPIAATIRERHALPLVRCACGKRGCIEEYVSARGLKRLHAHAGGEGLDAERVVAGMRAGDAASVRAMEIWFDCVASCLAQLILHIDPEVIVLGGGLSGVGELYTRLPDLVGERLLRGVEPPAIVKARFGDSSGTRGAAVFAAQRREGTGSDFALPSTRR